MLEQGLNAPLTTSVEQLFDALAGILGLCLTTSFEGQAATALEGTLEGVKTDATYPFDMVAEPDHACLVIDWGPMVQALLEDRGHEAPAERIAATFHNTLVDAIVAVAVRVGEACVVLTGGCFQNWYLTEFAVQRLREAQFRPHWHHRVAPNDGVIVKQVHLAYVPEAQVGDYFIVHVGFAVSKLVEKAAAWLFEYLRQMGELGELEVG